MALISNSSNLRNFNFTKAFIFTLFFLFTLLTSNLIKAQTTDLDPQDYDNFKKRNLLFMITICNFKDTKCTKLKSLFDQVFLKLKMEHLVEIKFPFLDTNKFSEKLINEYSYEGFPVIYYINQSDSEKEVFFGTRDLENIYKFLKYKLIFPDENLIEAKDDTDAIEKINNIKGEKALIIMGEFKSYPQFSFSLFQKAARKAGLNIIVQIKSDDLLEKYEVVEFDLAIYDSKIKYEKPIYTTDEGLGESGTYQFFRLKINKQKNYQSETLSQAILIADINKNKNDLFKNFTQETFEFALNQGLTTMFYLYSDKEKHLSNELEESLQQLASQYQNEIIFTKGSINHKIIKSLKFVKHYNITKKDLPMILFTKKPQDYFNKMSVKDFITYNDDVEKYILKNSQLKIFVDTFLKSYMNRHNINESNQLTLSSEIIETLIERIIDQVYPKSSFHTESEKIQMNGENFIMVINEGLEEENSSILLMICPRSSKKYSRIRSRIERVFNIVYEANDKKIIFDEFDPLENEISYINYNYYPTIAFIQKSKTPKKWKVKLHNGKLTTYEITKFIKNSLSSSLNEIPLENEGEVSVFEKENPLYPINKLRYEGKIFSEGVFTDKINVGLKRRWNSLKKNKVFLTNGIFEKLEYPNNYNEDNNTEDFDFEDDVLESHLHKNEDETKNDL